jgi:hypothetical protein
MNLFFRLRCVCPCSHIGFAISLRNIPFSVTGPRRQRQGVPDFGLAAGLKSLVNESYLEIASQQLFEIAS